MKVKWFRKRHIFVLLLFSFLDTWRIYENLEQFFKYNHMFFKTLEDASQRSL